MTRHERIPSTTLFMRDDDGMEWEVPRPLTCNEDLNLMCGHCKTYPLAWRGRNWNCRTRGESVCFDTHACVAYREDPERVARPEIPGARFQQLPGAISPSRLRRRPKPPAPKQDLRTLTGGVVYFLDCAEFTKIGHTSLAVAHRVQGLQASNPFPVRLWGLIKGSMAIERRFHAKCQQYNHHYEWFRLTPRSRRELEQIIAAEGGEVYPEPSQ